MMLLQRGHAKLAEKRQKQSTAKVSATPNADSEAKSGAAKGGSNYEPVTISVDVDKVLQWVLDRQMRVEGGYQGK